MVERICPQCHYGNPLDDRFCGRCGTSLDRHQSLAPPQPETGLSIAGYTLSPQWKKVGQAMAVSIMALAAEAGVSWLRRRLEQGPSHALTHTPSSHGQSLMGHTFLGDGGPVTVRKQRVVQIWNRGEMTHQIVERTTWIADG